jgi:hypothetical protein
LINLAAFEGGSDVRPAPVFGSQRSPFLSRRRAIRPLFTSPSTAVAALIDNAFDAKAGRVDVVLAQDCSGSAVSLAVLDDGVGMVPEMVRAACAPKSSCRLGDGPHLARDGLGLPNAPFALGNRFTLMSRTTSHEFAGVCVDRMIAGPAAPAATLVPPEFLRRHIEASGRRFWRTIVVIDLARDQMSSAALRHRLRREIGFLYERLATRIEITIDGAPLIWDSNLPRLGPRADFVSPFGKISLRSTYRPRGYPCDVSAHSGGGARSGLIANRLRRRVGPVCRNPLWRTVDSDRRWRIDLDFMPDADKVVRPTRLLDGVDLDPTLWTYLSDQGLTDAVEALRAASG